MHLRKPRRAPARHPRLPDRGSRRQRKSYHARASLTPRDLGGPASRVVFLRKGCGTLLAAPLLCRTTSGPAWPASNPAPRTKSGAAQHAPAGGHQQAGRLARCAPR
jgi:hypothetical protein